jgi:hypothetical protein
MSLTETMARLAARDAAAGRPAPRLYTIRLAGTLLAEAETFAGATLALRTLAGESPNPGNLTAHAPSGQLVAWAITTGAIGTFQGAETWR